MLRATVQRGFGGRGLKTSALSLAASSPSSAAGAKPFDKVLIANRGEIACRVMRTCKRLGIKTVAVYSEADANALHVRQADEAICIGPPPTNKSYLVMDAIVDAVRKSGAQAVHPGYGFLSENLHFAERLTKENVVFVGPNPHAIDAMGDKIHSKSLAKAAGVSIIPGFDGVVENAEKAIQLAEQIGYPVMLKASAGGGGKGMRFAFNADEVRDGFRLSKSEAASSFGDDRLLIEKYIDDPRHIEIQVIGDKHGNVLYLNERECSIQRRNQKVLEEAPSSFIDPATRKAMGEQAVMLCKSVGYDSAGTCEFLVDSKRNFYFLEMNTRLQVEHPITECITGVDLVELMLRSAAGQKLPLKQSDIGINGWAFEARVYAEDSQLFMPSIGRLSTYIEPPSGELNPKVRCDTGIVEGSEISMYYDPMICKLIATGATRDEALNEIIKALDLYVIKGVTHNAPVLRDMLMHPRFRKGDISTKFIQQEYPGGFQGRKLSETEQLQLVGGAILLRLNELERESNFENDQGVPEGYMLGEASEYPIAHAGGVTLAKPVFSVSSSGRTYIVDVNNKDSFQVTIQHSEFDAGTHVSHLTLSIAPLQNGVAGTVTNVEVNANGFNLASPLLELGVNGDDVVLQRVEKISLGERLRHLGSVFDVKVLPEFEANLLRAMPAKKKKDTSHQILSPMPGSVVSIGDFKHGDLVAKGQEVAVVEAMKMQNSLRAASAGKIKRIYVKVGDTLTADQLLVEFYKTGEIEDPKAAAEDAQRRA